MLIPFSLDAFIQNMHNISYATLALLTFLSGYLIPLPEEVALLFAGYVAGIGPAKAHIVVITVFCAVVAGDNVLYYMSLKGSRYVEKWRKKIREGKLRHAEDLMRGHIGKTIFFLRFIVGFRSFGPVIAGMVGVPWRTFFFFNGLASFLHVVLFVGLGYVFRNRFLLLVSEVEVIRHILFFSSATILGLLIARFVRKEYLVNKRKGK
ncbi:MAG TPA: DedA family protein [Candidatus Moranbacteria bacterium]|nr:DedA family protein [Candidatus Moranbacteria bacterium]